MSGNATEDAADAALEAVRQCFVQIDQWIPVLGDFLEMITQWPEARHDRIYDLADSFGGAAELYRAHLDEIQAYLNDLSGWQGDGAARVVQAELRGYLDEAASMAEGLAAMQQMVHGKALEIESMKWMAVITLVMMAVALIQAIITIWTGVGAAAGAAAIATGRVTIQAIARELLRKLWQETVRQGVRRFIHSGVNGVARTAVRGGLAYAAFTAGAQGGILTIQALEGHDPFTEGWAGRFGMDVVDSFIAGAIGGPLTFGVNSRVAEAVAFGAGQVGDNLLQVARDRLIDSLGATEWAQRNGLYSGMTLGGVWASVAPAALLGEILSEPRRGSRPDIVMPALSRGAVNLFAGTPAISPTAAPAGLPSGLVGASPTVSVAGDRVSAITAAPSGAGSPGRGGAGASPAAAVPVFSSAASALADPVSTRPAPGVVDPVTARPAPGEPAPASTRPASTSQASVPVSTPSRSVPTSTPSGSAPASVPAARAPVSAPTAGAPVASGEVPIPAQAIASILAPPDVPPPKAATSTVDTSAPLSDGVPLARTGDSPSTDDGHRAKPRWHEWRMRIEMNAGREYARGVDSFFGSDGSAARPPNLTPAMVRHALDSRPDRLDAYGRRLRDFLEQHFTRVDESGKRRPLDQTGIAAKLDELRGGATTAPAAPGPTRPSPDLPNTDAAGAAADRGRGGGEAPQSPDPTGVAPPPGLGSTRKIGPTHLAPLEDPRFQWELGQSLRAAGGYAVGADPSTHPYGRLVNDGGPNVPGRGNNCVDCSLAALSSFHGRPEVSSPRWPDRRPDGTFDRGTGEADGLRRAAQWLGEPWTGPADVLPDDPAGRAAGVAEQYRDLHRQIAEAGPGASALVVADWLAVDPDTGRPLLDESGAVRTGGGHAFVVVYPHGADGPVWWDPQNGVTWRAPPPRFVAATHTLWSIRADRLAAGAPATPVAEPPVATVPAGPAEREYVDALRPEVRARLEAALRAAEPVAVRTRADLGWLEGVLRERFGTTDAKLLGDGTHDVKRLPSLARKFIADEERLDVEDFLRIEANDLARFSLQAPKSGYADVVAAALDRLAELGYRYDPAADKSFWRPGNRFYGRNVTLPAPDGHQIELQFPTPSSWDAGKRTHGAYEIVRVEDGRYTAEERVHAFLEILKVNREAGLADQIPDGMDPAGAKDTSFAKWLSQHSKVWARYRHWLAREGRTFADEAGAYGLGVEDFAVDPGLEWKSEGNELHILGALPRRGHPGGADGPADRPAGGGQPEPEVSAGGSRLEPHETGVGRGVRVGEPDDGQPEMDRPDRGRGPGYGRTDSPGEPGHRGAERGGDAADRADPVALRAQGTARSVVAGDHRGRGAGADHAAPGQRRPGGTAPFRVRLDGPGDPDGAGASAGDARRPGALHRRPVGGGDGAPEPAGADGGLGVQRGPAELVADRPPGVAGAGTGALTSHGYLDEQGIRHFESDAAGAAYGEEVLGGDFTGLPEDQQRAVREYTRHSWPYNAVARTRDVQALLDVWWADGGTADIVRSIFGPSPTLSDVHAVARRGPPPGTWERWLVDRVLGAPEARRADALAYYATNYGARGMLFDSFGGRFPSEADLRERMALVDKALADTRLPEDVATHRGLRDIGFMRDLAGDRLNLRRDPATGAWTDRYGRALSADGLRRALVGTVQGAGGYMSTSLGTGPAFSAASHPFRIRLNVPRGSPGLWLGPHSVYPDQREMVLPRDARYEIVDVRPGPDGTFEIVANVLGPEVP